MPTAPPSSDAAVEARVFWLRFQKEIAAALIIVILAIIGFAGYRFYTYRRNSTAAELLGQAKTPNDYQAVIERYPGTPAGASAYLLLEFLELRSGGDFASLGTMLAAMHRRQAERYGWPRDNYIGATAQPNGWSESWMAFWRERRLEPQLALAARNGYRIDVPPVWQLLEGHEPAPSLLHGDLWSGNAGFLPDGAPALFDPAVYYGDREADLAMTELFGGFARQFHSAYEAAWPLAPGYARRKHLYNLYHLLNHLNLFGGGYLAQVRSALRLLARGL